jgi:hypothetical protein
MKQNKFLRMEKREEKMKKNKAYQANLIESLRDPSEEVLRYVEKQDLTPVYAY